MKGISCQSFILISFLFIEYLSFFFSENWILFPSGEKGIGQSLLIVLHLCHSSPADNDGAKRLHGGGVKDWRLRVVLFFLYHLSVRKKNFLEYVSRPQLADLQSLASCYIVANQIFSSQHGSAPLQISEIQKIKFVLSFCF